MDLYPHEFTEYVILVKSELIEKTAGSSDQLLKSPLFTVWTSAIVVFSVVRILVRRILCFRYSISNDFLYILFNTFGLSFGTTPASGLNSRTEKIIVLFISLFGVLAGIFCAGFLFEQLTHSNFVQVINSFEDLLNNPKVFLGRAEIPWFNGNVFPNNA